MHGKLQSMVMGVEWFGVMRAAGWAEWLGGGEKRFNGLSRRTIRAVIALRPLAAVS